jgi:hypothetical protein
MTDVRSGIGTWVQRISFNKRILRESDRFVLLISLWRICRCDAEMPSLDDSTSLNEVACHLLLSFLPTHIRDILLSTPVKKLKF